MKYFIIIVLFIVLILSSFLYKNETTTNAINLETLKESSYTGKEIFSNYTNLMASKNRQFNTSMELQSQIIKNKELQLERDVYSNIGLFIEGTKIIKSSGGNEQRTKIVAKSNSVMFYLNNADVVFENIDFYLVKIPFFMNELDDSKSKVKFINCRFFIEDGSSLTFGINNLEINNSMIIGNSSNLEGGLLVVSDSSQVIVDNNLFYDYGEKLFHSLYVNKADRLVITRNIVVSKLSGIRGLVVTDKVKNALIEGNLLMDVNNIYREEPFSNKDGEDAIIEGTIGVVSYNSEEIKVQSNILYVDNAIFPIELDINKNTKEPFDVEMSQILNSNFTINCVKLRKLSMEYLNSINTKNVWGYSDLNNCN